MTLAQPISDSNSLFPTNGDGDGELRLPPGADKLIEAYQYFMSPEPTSARSIPPSPMLDVEKEEGGVDWEDPRIQRWSETREVNGEWMTRAIGIASHLGFIHVSRFPWARTIEERLHSRSGRSMLMLGHRR